MLTHVYNTVPPNYDSMIGKIIAYGDTREQAMALPRLCPAGDRVKASNHIPLHQDSLSTPFMGRHRHPLS